jgi:hypothetical protein
MQQDAATPSSIGYTIGYDIDGVLKQKDETGLVTPVGAVPTQRLDQSLSYGDNSGTYSIIMGTATFIKSSNGTGIISLDYGSTSSVYISVTSSTITSSLQNSFSGVTFTYNKSTSLNSILLSDNSLVTQVGTTTYSVKINQSGDNLSITHNDSNIGANGTIKIFETGKTYDGVGSENKAFVHINTKGATTSRGVQNSVVIGGEGLTASKSNTVYLGNNVNINNAFTLPNTDGLSNQVLITNGSGTVSWATFSLNGIPLSKVLSVDNNSASYSIVIGSGSSIIMSSASSIIMSTASNIKSDINTNQLDLNYLQKSILISTDNGNQSESYLQISTSSTMLQTDNFQLALTSTQSTIYTNDLTGLRYLQDYSTTFVNESLVTKRYVDANSGSYNTYRVVYVDVNRGNNSTALTNRPDKPFSDINTAILGLTTSYTLNSSDTGLVYIRKGYYTDVAPLRNNINYYCEQNVVFYQNGFTDLSNAVSSSVYGYASFIGADPTLLPLTVNNASIVIFEFDRINTKQNAFNIKGASTVITKGNSIRTICDSGYAISLQNSTNLSIYVKEFILGAYQTIYAKSGFSGSLYVECPYIRVNGNLGSSGPQPSLVNALNVDINTTGTIKIKADIENISATFSTNTSAVSIGSGTVSIYGKLSGGVSNGLILSNGLTGDVTINGDITSNIESIVGLSDTITLKVNNSIIKTKGLGTYPNNIYINSLGSFYISNSTIYNTLADSTLINIANVNSVLGIYNTLGYSPGTTGSFAYSATPCDIGIHNTRSNNDNAINIEDLFDPSGFIYDPNLFIPNY